MPEAILSRSPSDLSSQHHLHRFSPRLRYGWGNIRKKVIYINDRSSVSSNLYIYDPPAQNRSEVALLITE
jgi:hypothetical protein